MKPYHVQEERTANQEHEQLEAQLRRSTLRLSRILRQREAEKRKPRRKKVKK